MAEGRNEFSEIPPLPSNIEETLRKLGGQVVHEGSHIMTTKKLADLRGIAFKLREIADAVEKLAGEQEDTVPERYPSMGSIPDPNQGVERSRS